MNVTMEATEEIIDDRRIGYRGEIIKGPAVDLILMPRGSFRYINGSNVRRISRRYWCVDGNEVKISRAIELIWG